MVARGASPDNLRATLSSLFSLDFLPELSYPRTAASARLTPCTESEKQVSGMDEDGNGGFELHGTVKPDAQPRSLGAFDAVVLSDAMAGNPGEFVE